ncbi:MAG: chemotaxis protein CheW [Bacteroidales bacterium]|jgi:purine-binding chemotaxis protein CheW
MEKEQILRHRAEENARKEIDVMESIAKPVEVLKFSLLNRLYALDIKYVSEVSYIREITPIPGTPQFVAGVINLRGKIISAISIKTLFSLEERGLTEQNRLIVLKNNSNIIFGVICDAIGEITKMDMATLEEPPANFPSGLTRYISGIFPDNTILLNANKLTTSNEIIIKK